MGEYQIEKSANGYTKDFITFLKENEDGAIIDDDGVINVQNLLGKKLGNGNGSNLTDVYVIEEEEENSYVLKYYTTVTTSVELATMGAKPEKPIEISTDPTYFEWGEWNETERTVTLLGVKDQYMPEITYTDELYREAIIKFPAYIKVNETTKITNIIIPSTVVREDDGKTYTVTKIGKAAFRGSCKAYGGDYEVEVGDPADVGLNPPSELESIIIPDSVTHIGSYAFRWCNNIREITLPQNLKYIGGNLFNFQCIIDKTYYKGTIEQWNGIEYRGSQDCFYGLNSVTCTDGITKWNYTNIPDPEAEPEPEPEEPPKLEL